MTRYFIRKLIDGSYDKRPIYPVGSQSGYDALIPAAQDAVELSRELRQVPHIYLLEDANHNVIAMYQNGLEEYSGLCKSKPTPQDTKFQPGDVVMLKSGGPEHTIATIDERGITIIRWNPDRCEYEHLTISNAATLKLKQP